MLIQHQKHPDIFLKINELFCSPDAEPDDPECDLHHTENTDPSEEAQNTT